MNAQKSSGAAQVPVKMFAAYIIFYFVNKMLLIAAITFPLPVKFLLVKEILLIQENRV